MAARKRGRGKSAYGPPFAGQDQVSPASRGAVAPRGDLHPLCPARQDLMELTDMQEFAEPPLELCAPLRRSEKGEAFRPRPSAQSNDLRSIM
ncbi:hypothetical protein GCM10017653_36160 [Ancylobacter defluvii]|uniref:Uncharacterized protein n=1 Tax=Ancylobacter defluvii TaxID=1282440 RepID=A0A9W6JX96_9HYPH|nr:hypothetical protein GCM10017653_36160 [Ancylobacter defluvii]